jgi:uncharacterized membrane protein YbhN (UPF0104 family)
MAVKATPFARRNLIVRLLKIAASICILSYLLFVIEPGALAHSFARANMILFGAAVLLLLPNLGFQYLKWRMLVVRIDPAVPRRDVLTSLFSGFSFGIITPARVGEFCGRAVAFRAINKSLLVGLTAIDKIATLLMTLLFGVLGCTAFLVQYSLLSPSIAYTACGIFLLLMTTAVLSVARRSFFVNTVKPFLARFIFLEKRLHGLDAFASFRRADALRLLALSFLFYCVFVAQFVLLLAAFGPVNPVSSTIGVMTILFAKTIIPPLTIGELGIRESASVLVLSYAGLTHSAAFNASILLFSINVLTPAVLGLAFILLLPNGRKIPR